MSASRLPLIVLDGPEDEDWIKAVARRRRTNKQAAAFAEAVANRLANAGLQSEHAHEAQDPDKRR